MVYIIFHHMIPKKKYHDTRTQTLKIQNEHMVFSCLMSDMTSSIHVFTPKNVQNVLLLNLNVTFHCHPGVIKSDEINLIFSVYFLLHLDISIVDLN